MKIRYLANRRRQKHESTDVFKSITEELAKKYTILESKDELFEGYELSRKLTVINSKRNIADLVLYHHEYDQHSFFSVDIEDTSGEHDFVFELKADVLIMLKEHYKATVVQQDDQSKELGKILYEKVHEVENRMRNIVNTVMIYHYGIDWYSDNIFGDDYRSAANPQNDWYIDKYLKKVGLRNSVYSLYFKQITEILENNTHETLKLDTYKEILALKQKTDSIDTSIIPSIEKPKSYWDQHFSDIFNPNFLEQWDDLNKRRNVIAHNKLIVKDFFEISEKLLEQRRQELINVQEKLNKQFGERYMNFIHGILQEEAMEALAWEEYEYNAYSQLGLTKFSEDSAEEFVDQSVAYDRFRELINTNLIGYNQSIEEKLDGIQEKIDDYGNLSFPEKEEQYKDICTELNQCFGSRQEFQYFDTEEELDSAFTDLICDFDDLVSSFEDLAKDEYYIDFTKEKSLSFKDILGNEIDISIDFDFFHEPGGANFYPIRLTHKFTPDFKSHFDKLSKSKYIGDDHPFESLLEETVETITSKGTITLKFGDFSEVDSAFYPESEDDVDVEYWMINEYLCDLTDYMTMKMK